MTRGAKKKPATSAGGGAGAMILVFAVLLGGATGSGVVIIVAFVLGLVVLAAVGARQASVNAQVRAEAIRARNERMKTIAGMLSLSPLEFEHATADIFRGCGYQLTVVGRPGDNAADILGQDPSGRAVVIQCKRYHPGAKVSSPEVQKFIGMALFAHRAQRALFVTTSRFTQPALSLAAQIPGLELIDGERLAELAGRVMPRSSSTSAPRPTSSPTRWGGPRPRMTVKPTPSTTPTSPAPTMELPVSDRQSTPLEEMPIMRKMTGDSQDG